MATLTVIGMALDEEQSPPASAILALCEADIIIGESRRWTYRYHKRANPTKDQQIYFLDQPPKSVREGLFVRLRELANGSGKAVLFSDAGMPCLFDPGNDVVAFCRALHYTIHTVPGPCSWAVACSLSGFPPPFLIMGFLPKPRHQRMDTLGRLKPLQANLVLMDTPYRFGLLLSELVSCFGRKREVFLAWEISKLNEQFLWANLERVFSQYEQTPRKGEFVLILKAHNDS